MYLVIGDPPSGGIVHVSCTAGPAAGAADSCGGPGTPATAVADTSVDGTLSPALLAAVTV